MRVPAALIVGFALFAAAASAQPSTPIVLMISIDGLRPDYVTAADKHGLKIPALRRFVAEGAFAEGVQGVMPTVTYPSHTTLITGVWPAKHGILANTIFDPLRKYEIVAVHFRGGLELAVDAAVALLEPRWIPRQIEMDEIRAISLQGDAFPGGIGADQDAQRLLLRICVEGGLHLLAAILPGGSGKDANALVCSVSVGKRFSQAPFQPTTGVLPFREDNEPAIIPVGAG